MKRIWQTKRASPRRRRSRTHSTPAAVSDGNLGVRPRVSNLKNATPGQILEALPKLESAQEEIVDLKLVIMPCIHDAIAKGKKYAVEQYISCININIQDENGWTPLHVAAHERKALEICSLLLQCGAEMNVKNKSECTPLHYFVHNPFYIDDDESDDDEVKTYFLTLTKFLKHVDVNAQNSRFEAPLHYAVRSRGQKRGTIRYLIEAGADVNIVDKRQNTPLLYAIYNRRLNIVQQLLAAGATVTKRCFEAAGSCRELLLLLADGEIQQLNQDPTGLQTRDDLNIKCTTKALALEKPRQHSSCGIIIRKFNSTASLYSARSSIVTPNTQEIVLCLARRYHALIISSSAESSNLCQPIFDESRYPLSYIAQNYRAVPTKRHVFEFLHTIFTAKWWHDTPVDPQPGIMALVYVDRLIRYSSCSVCSRSWRRIILAAFLVALKVWEEQDMWIVDFMTVFMEEFPRASPSDMSRLESTFLDNIHFDLSVKTSEYVKYYFEIRQLANDIRKFPDRPLSKYESQYLEMRAHHVASVELQKASSPRLEPQKVQKLLRCASDIPLAAPNRHSRYVLS